MIRYTLACDTGHRFDSWFPDSDAYEAQVSDDLVVCPQCASTRVCKAIMAPAVVGAREAVPATDDRDRKIRALLRQIHDKVVAEGHDVGGQFAVEARRIHDGLAPERQIYGQASLEEARELLEDGIGILPLPIVPDDLN